MRNRYFPLVLALFLAQVAAAEPVKLRSGAHDGFSRIVLDLPHRADWMLDQDDDAATLSFAGQTFEFDTSAVFDRIAQDRLTAVSAGPDKGSLKLALGCDCEIAAFWHGASSLVVDIRDAEDVPQEEKLAELSKPPVDPDADMTPHQADTAALMLPQNGISMAAELLASSFPPILPDTAMGSEKTPNKPGDDAGPMMAQEPASDISKTRETLLRQVGRAATQGLLSPRMTVPRQPEPSKTPDVAEDRETESPDAMASETLTDTTPTDHINFKAQSSIDRDFLTALAEATGSSGGAACLKSRQVDVTLWGNDAPFADQIGAVRLRLSVEFDKTNEAAALELARLYLYFGFGTEARQALILIKGQVRDAALLEDIAAIFEHGHAPEGSLLAGQLDCSEPVSLWSALSYQTLPADMAIDDNAVLRGFNALPPHLRRYLGPILSRRFLQAGHPKTSERLLNILDRSEETLTPDAHMVQAEIDIRDGAHDTAEQALHDVVVTNSQPAAEALLRQIEIGLEAGHKVSFETAQLAGAYAHEYRHEPLGRALYQAYVVALAASEAFDMSYQELARLKPELDAENWRAAQSDMLGFLVGNADEMTFLEHVFADHTDTPDLIDPEIANATAKRLLQLGFTRKARQFVEPPVTGKPGRARALLMAEISLRENHPRQAEADLIGLTGEDADLLRANARSRIGEHQAAAKLFATGDRSAMAEREAWLAEDWDAISTSDDPALADVAMLMLPDGADMRAGDVGVLAQGRSLIEASGTTRSTIEALLISRPVPEALKE